MHAKLVITHEKVTHHAAANQQVYLAHSSIHKGHSLSLCTNTYPLVQCKSQCSVAQACFVPRRSLRALERCSM